MEEEKENAVFKAQQKTILECVHKTIPGQIRLLETNHIASLSHKICDLKKDLRDEIAILNDNLHAYQLGQAETQASRPNWKMISIFTFFIGCLLTIIGFLIVK